MNKITIEMIKESYLIGKEVAFGTLSKKDAVNNLVVNQKMNKGSAQMYVTCVVALLSNKNYKSTVKEDAIRYFLDTIFNEYGADKLKVALNVLKEHLEYQDGKNNLPGMWNLYSEYFKK